MTLVDNGAASRSISRSEPQAGCMAIVIGGQEMFPPSCVGGVLSVKVTPRVRIEVLSVKGLF